MKTSSIGRMWNEGWADRQTDDVGIVLKGGMEESKAFRKEQTFLVSGRAIAKGREPLLAQHPPVARCAGVGCARRGRLSRILLSGEVSLGIHTVTGHQTSPPQRSPDPWKPLKTQMSAESHSDRFVSAALSVLSGSEPPGTAEVADVRC